MKDTYCLTKAHGLSLRQMQANHGLTFFFLEWKKRVDTQQFRLI